MSNSYMQTNEVNESFDEYQRAVRGRATEINDFYLRSSLEMEPGVSPARRRARSQSPHQMNESYRQPRPTSPWEYVRPVEHSDYTYGESAKRLQGLLYKCENQSVYEGQRNVQFTPRGFTSSGPIPMDDYYTQYPRGELPTVEDTAQILQNQKGFMQQLQIENKYVKDEMQLLKIKVQEVIEENRLLHEELKRTAISEIVGGGLEIPGISQEGVTTERITMTTKSGQGMNQQEISKWQKELERIHVLHTAKADRLESQLKSSRDDNDKYEATVNELQARVRILETVQGSTDPDLIGLTAGLCIRCAQNEAILPPSVAESQKQSLDQITRERDGLLTEMGYLKMKYSNLRQREDDAYDQVKKAVEMVEQAQLEQTQALIQKEQLKQELMNMRNRLEDHVEEITRKLTDERELVRKEYQMERDELNLKVKELTEAFVNCQNELEKSSRDKVQLMAELEVARDNMDHCGIDYGQATDSMKMTMTHATLERNKAVQEMARIKKHSERYQKDLEQEKIRLKTELETIRGRLIKAEYGHIEAKEQCVTLTNNMQQTEREAHMAKLAKDMVEKNRSSDLNAMTKRAEQRESELNFMIETLEAKHNETTTELEELLHQHESLVHKLQTECKRLAAQLETSTGKYKRENRSVKSQNEQVKMRMERTLRRLIELENQHTQGGILQEKMRQRLKQMDEHALHSSTQLLDLLARESSLMKDRAVLAREVEFLRCSLKSEDTCHLEKLLSSQHGLVDDILSNVRKQETKKAKEHVIDEVEDLRENDIDDLAKDYGDEKASSSLDTEDILVNT